jgi:hypothetical protein
MSGSRRGFLAVLVLLTVAVVPARTDVYTEPPSEPLPEVTIPAPRIPWARRTDRWTKPMPYPGDPDEVADIRYSLFHKRIGYLRWTIPTSRSNRSGSRATWLPTCTSPAAPRFGAPG